MTITRKEIITDEALNFGVAYEKNVILAIEANNKLLKTAQELDAVIVNIGKASGNKEFLQAKREEIALTDKASDLLKKESQIRQNLEKEKQQALRTQKLAIDVQNKENRQKQNSSNLTADEKLQIRLKNKEQREEAILTSKLVGAYQKLALQHKQAATNLQNLTVEYGKNNAKTKQAQAEFNKLDSRLRKADEAAKQFGRNVGNYPNQMGRAIGSLKQLATALGVVGGVTLLARELKNSVNVVRDFEKIMKWGRRYIESSFNKSLLKYSKDFGLINANEHKILKILKSRNFDKIIIYKNNDQQITIESTSSIEVLGHQATELNKILGLNDYQRAEIIHRNKKNIIIKKTNKAKIDLGNP